MTLRKAIAAFVSRMVDRRLAIQLTFYSVGVAVLLVVIAGWICSVEHARAERFPELYDAAIWDTLALADIFALMLLGIGLLVVIPASIAALVAGEQQSGTLEQLRTTPIRPLGLLLGLVIGAPVRLYLLCLGPLALHVFCGVTGRLPPYAVLAPVVVLAVGGFAFSLIGAVIGLTQQRGRSAMVTLGLAGVFAVTGLISVGMAQATDSVRWAFLHPAGAVHALLLSSSELWREICFGSFRPHRFSIPPYLDALQLAPVLAIAVSGIAAVVLARAGCRKLAHPHLPLLSKPQALALFTLAAAAIMLPTLSLHLGWTTEAARQVMVLQIVFLPVITVLATFATPSFDLWAVTLRRGKRPSGFDDRASPHVLVWSMVGVFMALAVACYARGGYPHQIELHRLGGLVLWLCLAATLPSLLLFGSTRFTTGRTRIAYVFGILAHMVFQIFGIVVLNEGGFDAYGHVVTQAVLVLGVAVPLWVIWRQHQLYKRTLPR